MKKLLITTLVMSVFSMTSLAEPEDEIKESAKRRLSIVNTEKELSDINNTINTLRTIQLSIDGVGVSAVVISTIAKLVQDNSESSIDGSSASSLQLRRRNLRGTQPLRNSKGWFASSRDLVGATTAISHWGFGVAIHRLELTKKDLADKLDRLRHLESEKVSSMLKKLKECCNSSDDN